MHFCDPKDVTYIGCGLLASMSGSIESVALSLNHETVDRNTKLAFSEYQGWGWKETCKRNKLSQRSSALQLLCQLPSVTLVAGRPQRGAQIPRAFPFVHSRKKASPPTSSKERLSAHISLSLSAQILKHFWQHVCITPMQCYRRRSQKSKIPQISLGHFRNIVYPTGGE